MVVMQYCELGPAEQASLAVVLETRIRGVSCSNLAPDADYLRWGFSWFSSGPSVNILGYCVLLGCGAFLPNRFQFILLIVLFEAVLCEY
jgi:hypothetical protein